MSLTLMLTTIADNADQRRLRDTNMLVAIAAASSSSLGREFSHGLGACLRSAIVATTCDADQPSELAVARVLPLFVVLA